ncbi:hypothetical protein ES695_05100 [Candidatus Atribacteria bacterium 1244-E10-H5-B2]|nr:MAG: hypothetical protein ES695_05100 [Candidatus Atribacteria bacterium 1244-E10-H5-B2]
MEYLEKFDAMKNAIQECYTIDEIKPRIDEAEAIRYLLIKAKESPEYIRMAMIIKLRAERRAGTILRTLQEQRGRETWGGDRKSKYKANILKLSDYEVTPVQSSYWQLIDYIPEDRFEKYIGTNNKREISTSGIIQLAKEIKKEELRDELARQGKDIKLTDPKIQLINDDFRKVELEENSIDLVFTDPPYTGEDLDLWSDLSEFAGGVLKPSSFLITYSGQMYPLTLLNNLSKHLIYYWTFCLYHTGRVGVVLGRNIENQWKPILIFQKEPFKRLDKIVNDYIENDVRQKGLHDWQQGENGAGRLIEIFSKENDLICDPMMGSGTFPIIAYKMRRRAIGIEINEKDFNISKRRIIEKGRGIIC